MAAWAAQRRPGHPQDAGQSASGYPDHEQDPQWELAFVKDPFHRWTYAQRKRVAFSKSVLFEPGTNWSYSHTNFMVLGRILAKVGGSP